MLKILLEYFVNLVIIGTHISHRLKLSRSIDCIYIMVPEQIKIDSKDQSEICPDFDDDDDDCCPFLLAACSEFADNPEALNDEIEEYYRLKAFFKPMMKYPSPFD